MSKAERAAYVVGRTAAFLTVCLLGATCLFFTTWAVSALLDEPFDTALFAIAVGAAIWTILDQVGNTRK